MYYKISDLKKLVDVMSRREKKYFTLFLNAFMSPGENANYVQLFHALQKEEFESPKFPENASSEVTTTAKIRLFNNILRCLAFYHQKQSVETIIQNYLTQIEILNRLSLPEQSLYLLQKARSLALRHEKFGLMLQLLEWERRLNIVIDIPIRSNAAIKKEEKEVLAQFQQLLVVESIYSKVKEFKKKYGYVRGAQRKELYKETIGAEEMPAKDECMSKKALFYFNLIHGIYHWMIFNHEIAYTYTSQLSSSVQVVVPDDYVAGIFDHVTSCLCLGKFKVVLEGLEMAAKYIKQQKLDQSHSFSVRMDFFNMCYTMIVYNYSGNKVKLEEAIEYAEKRLENYDALLSKEMKRVIMINLMNAYLGVGDLNKLNKMWDTLFNKKSQHIRRSSYDNLYLFRLFNLLQNEFYWMVPSMALSALRYYKKYDDYQTRFMFELNIVAVFQENTDFEKEDERKAALMRIKAIIKEYYPLMSATTHFQEQYTLFEIWAGSLYNKQPFHIEARKWYDAFKKQNASL